MSDARSDPTTRRDSTSRPRDESSSLPPDFDPLYLRPVCAAILGVDPKTIKRYEQSGVLPPPIRVTSRVVGHRRSTIERLLSQSFERGG